MNKDLKKRWQSDAGVAFVERLVSLGYSGNGLDITESPFGHVPESGKLDLRGMKLPDLKQLRCISIKHADCSGLSFKKGWIERSHFLEVHFDGASLPLLSDQNNRYEECSFVGASFKDAVIGHRGTKFNRCRFVEADFRGAGCVRPEFNDCLFDSCLFEGVDFRSGSFERCEFRGVVRGVWFRGNFPVSSVTEQFANPRVNTMARVSFKGAKLLDVTFSDHCDLSTTIPPEDGQHLFVGDWPKRIKAMFDESRAWQEPHKRQAEIFYTACKTHAEKQDWYIISLDDIVEVMDMGPLTGEMIWKSLRDAKC